MTPQSESAVNIDTHLQSRNISVSNIPIIDIAPFLDGSDKVGVADKIGQACRDIGFLYIRGHGISQQDIDAMHTQCVKFFDKPLDEKMAMHLSHSGQSLRGYTQLFGENTDPNNTQDMKECVDIGPEPEDTSLGDIDLPFHGANLWPQNDDGFRNIVYAYHQKMVALAHQLIGAIALSLELDEDYFRPFMQNPITLQRILHYPPQSGHIKQDQLGCGAHTDYGFITILAQDDIGGLQVQNRNGEWITAPPIEGTFIVNIGDLIQRWTNDTYTATTHRVINTSGKERYSMPFFFDADYHAEIAPVPGTVSDTRPRQYKTVTCGEHKFRRYRESFPHLTNP